MLMLCSRADVVSCRVKSGQPISIHLDCITHAVAHGAETLGFAYMEGQSEASLLPRLPVNLFLRVVPLFIIPASPPLRRAHSRATKSN